MIKNIFFDVDGTMYHEKAAKIKAETVVLEIISVQANISLSEVYYAYESVTNELFKDENISPIRNDRTVWFKLTLEKLGVNYINPEELSRKYWDVLIKDIELFYDFKITLPLLAEKYNLYIITDELIDIQKEKLQKFEIIDYFKEIISASHVNVVKPDLKIFEYALEITKSKREESLMIGDNPARDIIGGNQAGMRTAWLKRDKHFYYQRISNEEPDIIINNYIHLIDNINALK